MPLYSPMSRNRFHHHLVVEEPVGAPSQEVARSRIDDTSAGARQRLVEIVDVNNVRVQESLGEFSEN